MADSFLLHTQALAFLQQQLFSEMATNEGGSSLIEALLGTRQKSGREISASALTGRIRSDAGMLRQASRNVIEGGVIAETAREGTSSIVGSLEKMKKIAQDVANGTAQAGDVSGAYNDLISGISGTVKSTAYNGISLMDKAQWANDHRLSVAANGKTASLSIQSGTSARTLTLTDFSTLPGALSGTDITSNAAGAVTALSGLIDTVKLQNATYDSMAKSFASEAKSFERQATVLDVTAARARTGAAADPASRLLYRLLSDQGKIFDQSL